VRLEHGSVKVEDAPFVLFFLETEVLVDHSDLLHVLPHLLQGLDRLALQLQPHLQPGALQVLLLVLNGRAHLIFLRLPNCGVEVLDYLRLDDFVFFLGYLALHRLGLHFDPLLQIIL